MRKKLVVWLLLVLVDQASKNIASTRIPIYFNQGISFGWAVGVAEWLIVLALLLVFLDAWRRRFSGSDVLILAGGASNLLDRLIKGGVVDWIELGQLKFNVADVMIAGGVLWIILSFMRTTKS